MKIICTQENLKAGLLTVGRIISTSNTLPILNNVLLKTENGQLRISATNLEIAISTNTRCKIEQEGSVCVPAKTLTEVVTSLPNQNITLTNNGGIIEIETDHYKTQIKGFGSEEFPLIPKVESSTVINIEPEELKKSIDMVVFAASSSETQPEISGVYITQQKNELKLVATDRYRLAEKITSTKSGDSGKEAIIPQKAILELSRILGGKPEQTSFTISDNQIAISVGETEIVSRLIDGQYPDYKQIIPETFTTTVSVSRNELTSALKTAGIFSKSTHSIMLNYDAAKKILTVTASSSDLGESQVDIEADIKGPSGNIAFNHYYLLDALQTMTDNDVLIKLNSDNQPAVLTSTKDNQYLYLVMPIKH